MLRVEQLMVMLRPRSDVDEAIRILTGHPRLRRPERQYFVRDPVDFLYEDDDHVIELLLWKEGEYGGSDLCCSFALCHPDSIDACFAELILELACHLPADVSIWDERAGVCHRCNGADEDRLRQVLADKIQRSRRSWQAVAGTGRARLTCGEAIQRFAPHLARR